MMHGGPVAAMRRGIRAAPAQRGPATKRVGSPERIPPPRRSQIGSLVRLVPLAAICIETPGRLSQPAMRWLAGSAVYGESRVLAPARVVEMPPVDG